MSFFFHFISLNQLLNMCKRVRMWMHMDQLVNYAMCDSGFLINFTNSAHFASSYEYATSWCHIPLLLQNKIPACFEFPRVKMSLFACIYFTDTLLQSDLQAQSDLIQTQGAKKKGVGLLILKYKLLLRVYGPYSII